MFTDKGGVPGSAVTLVLRLAKFGLVGVSALAVYLLLNIVVLGPLVSSMPAVGNMVSLTIALVVSYLGHALFTFAGHGVKNRQAIPRFIAVSLAASLFVSVLFDVMITALHLSIASASALVAVIYPLISFLSHSLFTFSKGPPTA